MLGVVGGKKGFTSPARLSDPEPPLGNVMGLPFSGLVSVSPFPIIHSPWLQGRYSLGRSSSQRLRTYSTVVFWFE